MKDNCTTVGHSTSTNIPCLLLSVIPPSRIQRTTPTTFHQQSTVPRNSIRRLNCFSLYQLDAEDSEEPDPSLGNIQAESKEDAEQKKK